MKRMSPRYRAERRVLAELGAIPTVTLRYWITRGYLTVSALARAELKRRGERL